MYTYTFNSLNVECSSCERDREVLLFKDVASCLYYIQLMVGQCSVSIQHSQNDRGSAPSNATLSQHKFHMDWPGIEQRPTWWVAMVDSDSSFMNNDVFIVSLIKHRHNFVSALKYRAYKIYPFHQKWEFLYSNMNTEILISLTIIMFNPLPV